MGAVVSRRWRGGLERDSVTQGLPPKPTCLSIVGGILMAGTILAAFALLPSLAKWVGAALAFLPSRVGLMQVVMPSEVLKLDFSASPTAVVFARPGNYALFTSNLDLLTINDAVLTAKAKPWFRLTRENGDQVDVTLVERGLALYDTPLAQGRPVAVFSVRRAGMYTLTHPTRPDVVYIVPDYTSGREGRITTYMLLEATALGAGLYFLRRRLRKRPVVVVLPPPSRLSREKFVAETTGSQNNLESPPPRTSSMEPHPSQNAESEPPPENARDILGLVRENIITVEQAETEIEALLLSQPAGTHSANWGAKLALTRHEAAAYAQGAGVRDLMTWRDAGWPTTCSKCGAALEPLQLSWWFVRDPQGTPGLRHIDCPPRKPEV